MPAGEASGDTVTLNTTSDTAFIPVGSLLYVQTWGWMRVEAVSSASSVTLSNPADTGTDAYADNAPAGTTLAMGLTMSISGPQGPAGSVSTSGFLLSANNLNDVANVASSRTNLGLGDAATKTIGALLGNVPANTAGLTDGESVWVQSGGLVSKSPAATRTALSLGTAALEDTGNANGELPSVDDASGLTNGEVLFATATGVESVDATTAKARLGITTGGTAMLLYQQVINTNGGTFSSGSRQTVPLNTELVDTGSYGSISGNQVTLLAGTYRYRFAVVGNEVDYFVGYLYNVTAGAVVANSYGTPAFSDNGGTPPLNAVLSLGQGRFTIASTTVFELSAECQTTQATNGFGVAGGFSPSGNYNFSFLALERE